MEVAEYSIIRDTTHGDADRDDGQRRDQLGDEG